MSAIALKFVAAGFIACGLMFLTMAIGAGWIRIRRRRPHEIRARRYRASPRRGRTTMTTATEKEIEKEIQAKGLNAPRLNPDMIDATIVSEAFHVFPGTTMTVCALTLKNGFIVIGESAAASPENFDREIGQQIARENARKKIWALEGYLLRSKFAA